MCLFRALMLAFVLVSLSLASASASIPLPRPSPLRVDHAWTIKEPVIRSYDFAQFAPTPPVVTPAPVPPAVAPVPAPIVVQAPPASMQSDILTWIWTVLGAIFTGIVGKIAFKPAGSAPSTTPAAPANLDKIITAILHPAGTSIIADPNLKAAVDAAFARVIASGIPGQAIQAAAGLVPGGAAIAAVVEPMVRKLVLDALGGTDARAIAPATPIAAPLLTDLIGMIGELRTVIESRLPPRPIT